MSMVFLVFMSSVFVNNFVLSQFLGLCPFFGVSRKIETAVGMGAAVTFVLVLAAAACFVVFNFVLMPLEITFLSNIVFILIIASIVQLVEVYLKKASPTLYRSLGIFLPLITTNCIVIGAVIINTDRFTEDFVLSIVHAAGAAIGFTLAIVLLASIREKIEYCNIPAPFKGFPIALISTGLMAIAFMGFSGLISL
ncbi:MAG: RnfABCDGE type electron transport complex subunit A [Defluviitaleaceae bacterium]|nr:RnfABCDGE type electron transport complex subunit A [Defluviitaleaceae bacterium]